MEECLQAETNKTYLGLQDSFNACRGQLNTEGLVLLSPRVSSQSLKTKAKPFKTRSSKGHRH